MRNTIRKVTMVVVVLITSCQVSENPNTGPRSAYATTRPRQSTKASGRPVHFEMVLANPVKTRVMPCIERKRQSRRVSSVLRYPLGQTVGASGELGAAAVERLQSAPQFDIARGEFRRDGQPLHEQQRIAFRS